MEDRDAQISRVRCGDGAADWSRQEDDFRSQALDTPPIENARQGGDRAAWSTQGTAIRIADRRKTAMRVNPCPRAPPHVLNRLAPYTIGERERSECETRRVEVRGIDDGVAPATVLVLRL